MAVHVPVCRKGKRRNTAMTDLKNIDEALTAYLRPQTYPVAVRMCESAV